MAEEIKTPADSVEEVLDTKGGKRKDRKLKWHERQYGAGWVCGFGVGIVAGFPLAMLVAAICKWFVDWLLA